MRRGFRLREDLAASLRRVGRFPEDRATDLARQAANLKELIARMEAEIGPAKAAIVKEQRYG